MIASLQLLHCLGRGALRESFAGRKACLQSTYPLIVTLLVGFSPALSLQTPAAGQPDSPPAAFGPNVGRYEPEGRLEELSDRTFALVVVTKCFPENNQQFVAFETKLQWIVADLDRSHPAGWAVDLRGNVGGNMWPMLAGIGPVLSEGDHLGGFFASEDHFHMGISQWRCPGTGQRQDVAISGRRRHAAQAIRHPECRGPDRPWYRKLWGSHCRGLSRPHARFFGEHTAGASAVNETFALSDGASLWLTIGVQADRNGEQYPDALIPDEAIRPSDKPVPDDQDPILQALWHQHRHSEGSENVLLDAPIPSSMGWKR